MYDEDSKVLILGANGNFGSKIAKGLVLANLAIIIAGRQEQPLVVLKKQLDKLVATASVEVACFEIKKSLSQVLLRLRPKLVINTCGPFQNADYTTAINCIILGINYLDLADSREFVNNFSMLNEQAIRKNCLAITGASTLPCLSSAVLQHYRDEFKSIDSLIFGISLGQKVDRGLATLQSILSYVGRRLKPIPGIAKKVYGWQTLYRQSYPLIGKRWMANCDVPDLDLLSEYFAIKSLRFSAGIESNVAHLGLWVLAWLIRLGFPIKLEKYAKILLKLSHVLDAFGSDASAMHMLISGKDAKGKQKNIKWFIIAKSGDGPFIPTIPAVLLAKKIIHEEIHTTGTISSVDLITLKEYLGALKERDIHVYTEIASQY